MKKDVIELFAGVGGFRVGLNEIKKTDNKGKAIERKNFNFVWANQWEPATKTQHAYECYKKRFDLNEDEISNEDIAAVDKKKIPNHSLLCGGFPCQDYSVARSLSSEKGIEGKKGVLWWQINEILKVKKTPFVLLENVDRLLKSPSKQRGRDFGIMLRCFDDLGYAVEWRVINAAEYGHPQRRRRVYIFAYKKNTEHYKNLKNINEKEILESKGLFAKAFPIKKINKNITSIDLKNNYKDLIDISNSLSAPFENSGYMISGIVYTVKTYPRKNKIFKLGDLLESGVSERYYLSDDKIAKYEYLRGRKKIKRIAANGKEYYYSEGAMASVDSLELPGRTMLTSEGTTNRSTHIIDDPETNRRRTLTPVECERLNQFPDNWTDTMNEKRRYFMMGNALVCGIIKKLSRRIKKIIELEK